MRVIYPFRASFPKQFKKEYFEDSAATDCNRIRESAYSFENNYFSNSRESFYNCKITDKRTGYCVTGLIALIDTKFLNKKIFGHERCILSKQKVYRLLFKKIKAQFSPIILAYSPQEQIKKNLNQVSIPDNVLIIGEDENYSYKIWETIEETQYYQDLYQKIEKFLIIDGHHRVSSINKGDLLVAFLVPYDEIQSSSIHRVYKNLTPTMHKKFLDFLFSNFNTSLVDKNLNYSDEIKNLVYHFSSRTYTISLTEEEENLIILEYLEKHMNIMNGKMNFYNYNYNSEQYFIHRNSPSILIPTLKNLIFSDFSAHRDLFPPHSTLFYPKIPDGFIVWSKK